MIWRNRHLQVLRLSLCALGLLSVPLLAQTPVPGDSLPSQPANVVPPPEPARLAAGSTAKLGIGDLMELSVFGVPELNTKARIGNNGDVYLPLIDYVHIADLTVDEAQDLIQKRLADGGFVRNPHVTIFVSESASQAINILGEVTRPGPYPAIGERHLFDLISSECWATARA